jgi:AAA domain
MSMSGPSRDELIAAATKLWGPPNKSLSNPRELRFGSQGSKSLDLDKLTFYDHEGGHGGGYVQLFRLAGIRFDRRGNGHDDGIIAAYDYRDKAGTLRFQVVRKLGKKFPQRRPAGNGDWIWNLDGVERIPYRLPELLQAAAHATVFVCEGEKDVEALRERGLIATTNPGGASKPEPSRPYRGKWLPAYSHYLRGRKVVIIPDNDEPGEAHALDVARKLTGIASSIRILRLPELPPKGDVSDWLAAGGTAEELERLAAKTPVSEPRRQKPPGRAEPGALHLRYGFEATVPQPLGTIVEGLLHARSVTLFYGPPKSGKSFLVTNLALAVTATDQPDWMGHSIIRPGPVLYVACEGHSGFWKRLDAEARERGWDCNTFPARFILATGRPMLIKVDERGLHYAPDPSSIQNALANAAKRGFKPVAIVIDTVFRSFGMGNVNASADMNVYLTCIASLTDDSYAVALVHHEIKSGGTPAGSVSLIGGADNVVHVWRETETSERRFWQVEMAKDDAETEPRAFALEPVPVGQDTDGRPAVSCVIRDQGKAPDATSKKIRGRPPSRDSDSAIMAELIYRELCNLLADPTEGKDIVFRLGMPPVRAVERSRLRVAIIRAGILATAEHGEDPKKLAETNRDKLRRALNRLTKHGKVIINELWIGLTR